jgi:hypothetical protein
MANLFRKYKSLYSSTTGSFGTGEAVTITPASVVGLPTDTEITLTFDRLVSGKMERIKGSISGANFVVASGGRGFDGSTEQAHTSPIVEMIWNAKDWNDALDGIDAEHSLETGVHDATKVGMIAGTQTFTGNKTFTGTNSFTTGVTTFATTKLKVTNFIVGTDTVTPPTATDTLVGKATTDTLTNKRITPRVVTATDDATAVIDVDVTDQYQLTAVANATEFTVSGTPVNGQKLIIRLKDAGAGKALTWTGFTAIGVTLPTTTVASKTHYIGCIYNSAASTWDAVAVVAEA